MDETGPVHGNHCHSVHNETLTPGANYRKAAATVKEQGAREVIAIVTHGILSGNALSAVESSALEKLIVTNTLPQQAKQEECSKIEVIDIAAVLAEVIRRSHYGESVSKL